MTALSSTELEAFLVALIAHSAKVDPSAITPDTDLFMDLGIDSLEGLKILAQVENRFKVTIPDHELMHLNTLEKIRQTIERTERSQED